MKNFFIFVSIVFLLLLMAGCTQTVQSNNNSYQTNSTDNNTRIITNNTQISSNNSNISVLNNSNSPPYVPKNYIYSGTFTNNGKQICTIDGKPIIRLYSTTWCPHCIWIKNTFDKVVNEYVAQGLIVAYHWEVDTSDNTLTSVAEGTIPADESAYFSNGLNTRGSIPYYVFGCKYERIGNGFESARNDAELVKEETEFRALIEKILSEIKTGA